jgi:hypothetical protein
MPHLAHRHDHSAGFEPAGKTEEVQEAQASRRRRGEEVQEEAPLS